MRRKAAEDRTKSSEAPSSTSSAWAAPRAAVVAAEAPLLPGRRPSEMGPAAFARRRAEMMRLRSEPIAWRVDGETETEPEPRQRPAHFLPRPAPYAPAPAPKPRPQQPPTPTPHAVATAATVARGWTAAAMTTAACGSVGVPLLRPRLRTPPPWAAASRPTAGAGRSGSVGPPLAAAPLPTAAPGSIGGGGTGFGSGAHSSGGGGSSGNLSSSCLGFQPQSQQSVQAAVVAPRRPGGNPKAIPPAWLKTKLEQS